MLIIESVAYDLKDSTELKGSASKMHNLHKEYTLLFNAITDAEKNLMQLHQKLIEVQQDAEELYISEEYSNEGQKTISA